MTIRLGLIGHPVSHSLSPPMHLAAFQFFGLQGTYDLLDIDPADLAERVAALGREGYSGLNVTIPHKQAVYEIATGHTSEAMAAGAANTIKISENGTKLVAHNTDIGGLRAALEEVVPASKASTATVCILGAGGAARAALIAINQMGFKHKMMMARDMDKAAEVIKSVTMRHPVELRQIPTVQVRDIDLLIHSTPIGQHSEDVPGWFENVLVPPASAGSKIFYDMVYARTEKPTPLVAYAKAHGWNAIDGTHMLVHQARFSFEFWTGKLPPFNVMKDALDQARFTRKQS